MDPLTAIAEPRRRRLYDVVAAAGRPVGRDEAAGACGIHRPLAAYHLDRLVDAGLLAVEYRRLGARRGPGAGRPAKLYRLAEREFVLGAPYRDYRLLAELLAQVAEGGDVEDVGRRAGRQLARDVDASEALRSLGYMPFESMPGVLRVRNCPFARVAAEHAELICRLNVAFVQGLLGAAATVKLDPEPGCCCLTVLQ